MKYIFSAYASDGLCLHLKRQQILSASVFGDTEVSLDTLNCPRRHRTIPGYTELSLEILKCPRRH